MEHMGLVIGYFEASIWVCFKVNVADKMMVDCVLIWVTHDYTCWLVVWDVVYLSIHWE